MALCSILLRANRRRAARIRDRQAAREREAQGSDEIDDDIELPIHSETRE
jgi:hypothetical protein